MNSIPTTVLRLTVRNHPGVMSHICGLFARRSFNLDAILCLPLENDERSAMLLRVKEEGRLDQLLSQLRKLEDVIEAERAPESEPAFALMSTWVV